MLTFAIGDIHGCHELLTSLLERIGREAGAAPHRLVFLGDYVDRGPSSAAVVATLRELQERVGPERVVCLMGNHEDLLLRATQRPDTVPHWLANGGDATLESYGARTVADLPRDVVEWIGGLPTVLEDDRRCYVHAGLNPAFPRVEQRDHDRLWIRDAFLESERDFGRYVVHGHTPLRGGLPDVRRTRVNIDTAAVYGGRLTAAMFSDEADAPVGFLQAAWDR